MAIQAKLFIDDKGYTLKYFNWGIIQGSDSNYQPTGKIKQTGLTLVMDAQSSSDFEEWAFESNFAKNLEIHMIQGVLGQGKTKILKCFDCHLLELKTNYNHTSTELPDFKLYITCGGIEPSWSTAVFSELWRKTFSTEVEATVIEEPTPKINSLKWINSQTQEKDITEIGYKESASLVAAIENAQGSTASITIIKEDGSEFEKGQTQLTFTENIEDGMIELTPMEIKEQWEDFKISDIDKLIAKVSHNDAEIKTSKPLTVIPPPKAIVDFRPSKNYAGEYGFDYMRHKNDKKDKLTYKDILGTNTVTVDPNSKKKTDVFTPYANDTKYNSLKDTHYNTTTFPWYKDSNGKELEYIQSWLSMYPNQKVTLSLQIDTIENSGKKDFTFEYDKTIFKLNTEKIPAQGKGKKRLKDHLEIQCIKEFDVDQTIKVMHDERQMGQLMVLKNSKKNRYKSNIVLVKVNTQLVSGIIKKGKTTGEQSFLEKYLNQALIKPAIVTEALDLTNDKVFNTKFAGKNKGYIDTRTGIHTYLNGKMDAKYKNYLKIYFIPDQSPKSVNSFGTVLSRINGHAMAIGSEAVAVYDGHNTSTTTHEVLHALGIRHTFSNHSAGYGYKKGETYNIMDYSHQSKYGSKKRVLTWLWQWKALWGNVLVNKE